MLAHTSEAEGCPNVVMEAMACGRPVVATGVGDVPHLVEHGVTGFLVPPDGGRELSQSLAALLGNHELCVSMGRAARARAEREFGLDRLVGDTLHIYRSAGWSDD